MRDIVNVFLLIFFVVWISAELYAASEQRTHDAPECAQQEAQ